MTYLTHEETGETQLAVFDAATMDSKPLATVPMPHRVPAGFHGLHIKVILQQVSLPLAPSAVYIVCSTIRCLVS